MNFKARVPVLLGGSRTRIGYQIYAWVRCETGWDPHAFRWSVGKVQQVTVSALLPVGIHLQRNPSRLPSFQPRQRSGTLAPAVSGPVNAPANAALANAPGCRCFLSTHSRSKQSNHYSVSSRSSSVLLRLAQQYRITQPTMRFYSPSPLCRCCSFAVAPFRRSYSASCRNTSTRLTARRAHLRLFLLNTSTRLSPILCFPSQLLPATSVSLSPAASHTYS
ncbi:hypothetical protein BHM03_00008169 [Ensete ventricosum]|nr:hypothetical protein BHM03_00008169 [Ensete ventricosum]